MGASLTEGAQVHPANIGSGQRFKLRVSAIVWFVLAVGFLLSLPVLIDVSWLVLLAVAVIALVLAVPGAWIVRAVFRGQRLQSWLASLAKAFLALLFFLGIAAAAPVFYYGLQTALNPLTVPQVTLSNGDKTVVFQGMSHVGSELFYKSVVYDLEQALVDGYVLYYEGVIGSPEGDAWFSRTLAGGGDLNTSYQMISSLCGLKFQLDYFGLLASDMAARPDRHVNADVTTADMMHEYDRLMQSDPAFAAAEQPASTTAETATEAPESGAGLTGIIGWLQNGSPELRSIAGTVCRGFMTATLNADAVPDQMDKVILDFRNRALAERIGKDSHELIYITYGAGHFPGLLADLQAADPAWEVQSLKWMRTIAAPEELDGKL